MKFYSQSNQDKWVCALLEDKMNGYFIDIGAYDGVNTSNTYTLEKYLNWNGICIEANLQSFNSLKNNRNCKCVHAAVSDNNGICKFGFDSINSGDNNVNCFTLDHILKINDVPEEIDYLSIDIEGHEHTVFSVFDFSKWKIKLMTVEHNLYCSGDNNKNKLYTLLTKSGFTRVVEDAKCLDINPSYFNQPYEDWYVNNCYMDFLIYNINKWNNTEV
jgi:FkbM family methyltransferase